MDFLYDWSTQLLVHLRDNPTGNLEGIETPGIVSWPFLLRAPDVGQMSQLETELKVLRREVQRYHPCYVGNDPGAAWGTQPVRIIENGRLLVKLIHGMTVTFVGEQRQAGILYGDISAQAVVRNEVSGGRQGNVVQVGNNYGGVHVHPRGDAPDDLRDPLVIDIELRFGLTTVNLVVDADPPRPMAPSGTLYVVTVQARTMRAVILHRARAIVLSRQPPRRACTISSILGIFQPRKFTINFDNDPPLFRPEGDDFPFTVSATDPEQFWFQPTVSSEEVAWRLEIDWSCLDHSGTAVIDNNGQPFETYPYTALYRGRSSRSALHWGCDDMAPHQPDCPVKRLNGAPWRIYGPVRPR